MENVLGLSVFKNHSTKINWSFKINFKNDKLLSNKHFLKTFVNYWWVHLHEQEPNELLVGFVGY
jgi:hypothetical protein